jgi:hypothetical protein
MIVEVTFLLNLNKTFSHVVRRFGKHCIQLKICIFLNSDTLFIFFLLSLFLGRFQATINKKSVSIVIARYTVHKLTMNRPIQVSQNSRVSR